MSDTRRKIVKWWRRENRDADQLCEAIRLTVEYVGTERLHPGVGWSWFDALSKYRPDMAQQFVDFHNRVVVPHRGCPEADRP